MSDPLVVCSALHVINGTNYPGPTNIMHLNYFLYAPSYALLGIEKKKEARDLIKNVKNLA